MPFTNYLQGAALEHIFGASSYSKPTVYVGLFTAAPGPLGGGTEVTGGNYARAPMGAVVQAGGSPTQVSNAADVNFPAATAAWGTILFVALFDAPVGGNMLAYGALQESRAISAGDAFRFPVAALAVSLN